MLNENLERIFSNSRGSAGVIEEKLPEPLVRDSSGLSCRAQWNIITASKTISLLKDEERQVNSSEYMHMSSQRRCTPQEQYNSARHSHSRHIYTEGRNDGVPVRRTDGIDRAFPLKPIHHKRNLALRTQDSPDPHLKEPEKFSSPPRGHSEVIKDGENYDKKRREIPLLSQEHLSNGIRQVTGSQRPRRELRLANAIYEKELILQEKLWRLEEKIGKKIQRDGTAERERHSRRQAEQEKDPTRTRASPAQQQRTEPMRSRESKRQDKTQEDIKWQSKKQDEWSNSRMRNTHEEERHRLGRRETDIFKKPQPNGDRRAEQVKARERGGNGELRSWERGNVKENEQNRRKERTGQHIRLGGETGMTSQQEKEKAKERGQHNKVSTEDIDWARENKYNERASKERYGSINEERDQDKPQNGQQRSAHTLATEKHSSKGRTSGEPLLPPVSSPSPSSRLRHRELSPRDVADTCLQLMTCKICDRKFSGERIEKHIKICTKIKQSRRKVFDSCSHRTKGTANEEFLKNTTRSRSPEIKKSNRRQNHEVSIKSLHQGRVPGGTVEPKPSIQANPDYVTCPHCSRRFAPGPAERHVPKCQYIKSRPPPLRCRQ